MPHHRHPQFSSRLLNQHLLHHHHRLRHKASLTPSHHILIMPPYLLLLHHNHPIFLSSRANSSSNNITPRRHPNLLQGEILLRPQPMDTCQESRTFHNQSLLRYCMSVLDLQLQRGHHQAAAVQDYPASGGHGPLKRRMR